MHRSGSTGRHCIRRAQPNKAKQDLFMSPTRSPIDDLGTQKTGDRRDSQGSVVPAPGPYITLRPVGHFIIQNPFDPIEQLQSTMHSTSSSSWHTLPNEMKLAIVDTLDVDDVASFSKVDQRTYQACVPAQFRVRFICNISAHKF